jgi:DNA polymerase (family 10)
VDNTSLGEQLEAFAALLELAGANPYQARAYRRAADLIQTTPADVAELVREGRVRDLRGIGAGIESKLRELVETGAIEELEELRRSEAERLTTAIARGRKRRRPRRLLLNRALALAEALARPLEAEVAGATRRRAELADELVLVRAAEDPAPVLAAFAAHPHVLSVLERGERRAVGVSLEGIPVELRVPPPARFGTELVEATGHPDWVAAQGPLAVAPDEAGALGREPPPPELREPWSPEPPPDLLQLEAIRGDLHVHSTWSDGKATIEEMALAAREHGYEYVAICDHTRNVRVVPGLDADDLRRQGEEIAALNERLAPFRILRGSECDILPDGSLDLPDDVLAELDWVQISLHAGQRAEPEAITNRVVEAMRRAGSLPGASCLSHPKGRILNHRPENAVDLERVFEVALETGVAVEVNGLPDRLDLAGEHVRGAMEAGVAVVCSTDAHSTRGLGNMQLAVWTARRGGATNAAVLNTRPLGELRK